MPPAHIILFLYLNDIHYSYYTAMTAIELSNLRNKYEGGQNSCSYPQIEQLKKFT